jgi:hypothetical protein
MEMYGFKLIGVLCAAFMAGIPGHAADDLDARLAKLPTPWVKPIHLLTLDEYDGTLKYWAAQHPQLVTVQERGRAHNGMPVFLVKITDAAVSDENKQVALVTSLHGGPERSGSTTALRVIEWLLGDSPAAKETRRKQIVLVVPIPNPYAFFVTDRFNNQEGIDLYDTLAKWWNLKTLTLTAPEKAPELAAVLSVVDEYRPEVHMDLHGTGFQGYQVSEIPKDRKMLQGVTMFEVSACSYSNCCLRPWDPRVTEAMVKAGVEAGYGSDRAEADAQRIFWSPDHDSMKEKLWVPPRPGRFRSPFYGYMKYHTMVSTTEVGWEDSGAARVAGILEIGNKVWVDEKVPGYPVNRVKSRAGRFITAYGTTASELRESRTELWQAQGKFMDGVIYPEYAGRASYFCAVTKRGADAMNVDRKKFIANLRQLPGVNADAIEKYINKGPEIRLSGDHQMEVTGSPIRHGIGFRIRIPYRAPELLDVAVNGHTLKKSATDGYESWYADGYTHVQVNLPPEKTKQADIYVVTCAYDPKEERRYGFEPPSAVQKQLRNR